MNDYIPLNKELLNEREVAYLLDVSIHFLQKKRRTGGFIPFTKLSKSVRYARKDVEAYLEERRFNSTAEYGSGGDND